MRTLIQAALLGAALCASPSAFANALPDNLRAAGVTVAEWDAVQAEVRRAAAARGASERALAAVAERVSANLVVNGRVDIAQVLASIDERAQQVAELQTQLAAMQAADDPAVAALLAQARAAIEAGDLVGGDALLAQAAEIDLAGIARDQARLVARQTRAAETNGERGRLAYTRADYLGAAALYARAAETAAQTDTQARHLYISHQADALQQRGDLFAEPEPLQNAIRLQRELLRDAPRVTHPLVWAKTQNSLGGALTALGRHGDGEALREAIGTYHLALEVFTRETRPADWAMTQYNLGMALRIRGERGDESALHEAVARYHLALEVQPPQSADWVNTKNNLGRALTLLGDRDSSDSIYFLHSAISAFQDALNTGSRNSTPFDWAMLQLNLGTALRMYGELNNQQRPLVDAVSAFRAATTVFTREATPALWATAQYNLALTYGEQGNIEEAQRAASLALECYEQVGDSSGVDRARRLISSLAPK
jgi:tetratricopeptide (TPR) repeat protein